MNTDIRYDSLPFEMQVGMTRKEFYDHCWQLNKEKKISQGPGNKYAKYVMKPDSLSDPTKSIDVLFYGIFDDEKVMHGMEMKMSYTAWSPWSEKHKSDKLVNHLKKKYMDEFGLNEFLSIDVLDTIRAFVKVDANRQILIYPLNFKDVMVKFEDLEYKLGK